MGGFTIKDTPNRAREWALHEFANALLWGGGIHEEKYRYPHYTKNNILNYDGVPPDYRSTPPVVGDLFYMQAAPVSQQWLGIITDITKLPHDTRYGVRGVGEKTIVNWTNIGICVVNRLWSAERPRFWWTEDQWKFEDWIEKAIRQTLSKADRYHGFIPVTPDLLTDDGSLRFRKKWSHEDEPRVSIDLPNWRAMKFKELKERVAEVPALFATTEKK